jgi:hypothetical protein
MINRNGRRRVGAAVALRSRLTIRQEVVDAKNPWLGGDCRRSSSGAPKSARRVIMPACERGFKCSICLVLLQNASAFDKRPQDVIEAPS